jgi:ubiquinone/menaquinone biosynthesis C-methylase UbiE
MAAKSQSSFFPSLLRHHQYSGAISSILYNWPLFGGALLFALTSIVAGTFLQAPWNWVLIVAGIATIVLFTNIVIASFVVYDWGQKREYNRLAELANLAEANVVIDVTSGKLRGTRGMLSQVKQGHYFVIDIYDSDKMTDPALRRARDLEPPLDVERRIYRRQGKGGSLPIPHNWADIVYCSFSLHELSCRSDRQAIFDEFARILKPGGQLLIAEQGRDLANLLVFGLGALSYLTPAAWARHITEAGLVIRHRERWRGLVHLWIAERESGQPEKVISGQIHAPVAQR